MKLRLLLAVGAMLVVGIVVGLLVAQFDVGTTRWRYVSLACTYAIAAFAGGLIAKRGFVVVAALVVLAVAAVFAIVQIRNGADPFTAMHETLASASVSCALAGAFVGAWSGQRLAAMWAARRHA